MKATRGLSVIITVRGDEPLINKTIANIMAEVGCPVEVIVVYDGEPTMTTELADQVLIHRKVRGVGPSRHKGIEAAKYPVVFLTDAHMNFSKGFGLEVLKHYDDAENAKDLTCGVSYGVSDDLMFDKKQGRYGCRFVEVSKEPGNEVWVMSGKWADQEPGEIGCVYGACYAFKKSWYKKIGEPLNVLRGWWGDEEYLSLATRLSGGRCVLLDFKAGHLFRDHPAYATTREDILRRTINRHRLVEMLPCPQATRDMMLARFSANAVTMMADYDSAKAEDDKRPEVIAAKKLWRGWFRRWRGLAKWTDQAAAKIPAARYVTNGNDAEPVSRSQVRKEFVCTRCKSHDTFRARTTRRVNGEKRQYGRCCECNLPAVKVKRSGIERILWGSDAD